MESNKTTQKKFAGIVSDVNQINIDIEKGAMADNFNGRVAQIGENSDIKLDNSICLKINK